MTRFESINLRDFLLTSATASAGDSTPCHQHMSPAILVILSGTISDGDRMLREGTIVCHRAPVAHAMRCVSERGAYVCVSIQGAFARHVREIDGDRTPATLRLALRMASDLRLAGPTREVSIRSTVLRLVAWCAMRTSARASDAAVAAQRFIEQHFRERIALARIASLCGIDPSRLARDYRRAFGMTVGDAIRVRRLTCAAELLSTSKRSIADIARTSGFVDASHLARAWSAAFGSDHERLR